MTNKFKLIGAMALLLLPGAAMAQASGQTLVPGMADLDLLLYLLLFTIFVLLMAVAVVGATVYVMLNRLVKLQGQQAAEPEQAVAEEGFWKWFWDKFNAAKPIGQEKDALLSHDYDGIHELDNDLPPWWKWMFYISIVFSVVYIWFYHFTPADNPVSVAEYETEVLEAKLAREAYLAKAANLIDETNVALATEATELSSGKVLYDQNCKACHGGGGEGGIGPNLTDEYWLHGGDIASVFKTVKYGVPQNGMLPWQDKMTPKQMQEVSSYILSLQGTNPPNAKAPQGEKFVP